MKIAIVGCGAVGSYYGAKLCRAGKEVHFLLRSDYAVVRRRGVFIKSPEGDFNVRPRSARTAEEIGECDLVIIALKTTSNDQFSKLLPPLVGHHTTVLTLQNGLGNEQQLARLFPDEQVMGGLCFVCLNRTEPGLVRHLGLGKVVLGELAGWPEPRTHDIAGMFRHAGVTCKVTDNLMRTHWEKLVWNIPFNGLGVASVVGSENFSGSECPGPAVAGSCLTTDKLLGDPRWLEMVRELMLEVIRAGNALGCQISETLAEKQIERTRTMGAYQASTLVDFERAFRWNWRVSFWNRCVRHGRQASRLRDWRDFAPCFRSSTLNVRDLGEDECEPLRLTFALPLLSLHQWQIRKAKRSGAKQCCWASVWIPTVTNV